MSSSKFRISSNSRYRGKRINRSLPVYSNTSKRFGYKNTCGKYSRNNSYFENSLKDDEIEFTRYSETSSKGEGYFDGHNKEKFTRNHSYSEQDEYSDSWDSDQKGTHYRDSSREHSVSSSESIRTYRSSTSSHFHTYNKKEQMLRFHEKDQIENEISLGKSYRRSSSTDSRFLDGYNVNRNSASSSRSLRTSPLNWSGEENSNVRSRYTSSPNTEFEYNYRNSASPCKKSNYRSNSYLYTEKDELQRDVAPRLKNKTSIPSLMSITPVISVPSNSQHKVMNFDEDYCTDNLQTFKCPYCKLTLHSLERYKLHLRSKIHKRNILSLRPRIQLILCNMRKRQRFAQNAVDKSYNNILYKFCTICRLFFKQPKELHNSSIEHEEMDSFLNPYCTICHETYSSQLSYRIHLADIPHQMNAAGRRNENLCRIEKPAYDIEKCTQEKNKEDIRKPEKKLPENIERVSLYNCELCNQSIRYVWHGNAKEFMLTQLEKHCRSKRHILAYERYVSSNDSFDEDNAEVEILGDFLMLLKNVEFEYSPTSRTRDDSQLWQPKMRCKERQKIELDMVESYILNTTFEDDYKHEDHYRRNIDKMDCIHHGDRYKRSAGKIDGEENENCYRKRKDEIYCKENEENYRRSIDKIDCEENEECYYRRMNEKVHCEQSENYRRRTDKIDCKENEAHYKRMKEKVHYEQSEENYRRNIDKLDYQENEEDYYKRMKEKAHCEQSEENYRRRADKIYWEQVVDNYRTSADKLDCDQGEDYWRNRDNIDNRETLEYSPLSEEHNRNVLNNARINNSECINYADDLENKVYSHVCYTEGGNERTSNYMDNNVSYISDNDVSNKENHNYTQDGECYNKCIDNHMCANESYQSAQNLMDCEEPNSECVSVGREVEQINYNEPIQYNNIDKDSYIKCVENQMYNGFRYQSGHGMVDYGSCNIEYVSTCGVIIPDQYNIHSIQYTNFINEARADNQISDNSAGNGIIVDCDKYNHDVVDMELSDSICSDSSTNANVSNYNDTINDGCSDDIVDIELQATRLSQHQLALQFLNSLPIRSPQYYNSLIEEFEDEIDEILTDLCKSKFSDKNQTIAECKK